MDERHLRLWDPDLHTQSYKALCGRPLNGSGWHWVWSGDGSPDAIVVGNKIELCGTCVLIQFAENAEDE